MPEMQVLDEARRTYGEAMRAFADALEEPEYADDPVGVMRVWLREEPYAAPTARLMLPALERTAMDPPPEWTAEQWNHSLNTFWALCSAMDAPGGTTLCLAGTR